MTRLADKTIVDSAVITGKSINADFQISEFEVTLRDKGYNVIHEKAVKCPCKSQGGDFNETCLNCAGGGWIFVNPTRTRMVLTSINTDRQYDDTAQKDIGMLNVTALNRDKLGHMDRITLEDGFAYHSEVNYPTIDTVTGRYFTMLHYDVKLIDYVGLFQSDAQPLIKLDPETDFTISNNIIILSSAYDGLTNPQITVRYEHLPVFHIWDIPRDTIISLKVLSGQKRDLLYLPVRAVAKRAHLTLGAENFNGDKLYDNSWLPACEDSQLNKKERIIRYSSTDEIWNLMSPLQRVDMTELMCGVFVPTFAKSFI